ncbi:MAG: type II secretion system protein [bacterium]|nr:type II secretion system protein [bacterium]
MKRLAFTLAEVLITLAIIGVVAAVSIPSVISNSQQQEFKTGLRKAVSVLNSAITMNMALDGESPYENADTFRYLTRHMSILKSTRNLPWSSYFLRWDGKKYSGFGNAGFYTTDGMRFEFDDNRLSSQNISDELLKLHESDYHACLITYEQTTYNPCGGCGSLGLKHNPNNTTKVPCALLVDVNGDKKPTPNTAFTDYDSCLNNNCAQQKYWLPDLESKRVSDIFVVLITEDRAIPYGVVAQKAMYQSQK